MIGCRECKGRAFSATIGRNVISLLRILLWPLLAVIATLIGEIFRLNIWAILWNWFRADPLDRTVILLTAYFILQLAVVIARFLYALLHAKSLVVMKVLLPRTDSKVDQEKRTEKDWKEKIAVMEQLFRALWEVKALNVWTVLHTWIWRFNTMSFELFVEQNEITFYVVARPSLAGILEKQITSFYPDAEVTLEEKTPEVWVKGTKLVGYYMKLQKSFQFPLRYYDHMQDDPLNDI